jgi:hypothetical protein
MAPGRALRTLSQQEPLGGDLTTFLAQRRIRRRASLREVASAIFTRLKTPCKMGTGGVSNPAAIRVLPGVVLATPPPAN